jgi:hypothetical protein
VVGVGYQLLGSQFVKPAVVKCFVTGCGCNGWKLQPALPCLLLTGSKLVHVPDRDWVGNVKEVFGAPWSTQPGAVPGVSKLVGPPIGCFSLSACIMVPSPLFYYSVLLDVPLTETKALLTLFVTIAVCQVCC